MKKILILMLSTLVSNVFADGFICTEKETNAKIKIFNYTEVSEGTRKAAIMIVSDENIAYGRKTVASFTEAKGKLISENQTYVAKVDLRVKESNRAGENVFGTKLGLIDTIKIVIDFNYSKPMESGEMTVGILEVLKRDGQSVLFNLDCQRYLKN